MTYCKYCEKEVKGQRPINWWAMVGWFIITIPVGGITGIFLYLCFWYFIKKDSCPICKMDLV